jgi:acyl-CoA thioesterase
MDAKELAERCTRAIVDRDAAAQAMGIQVLEIGPGSTQLAMTVRQDMCNGHGMCHGGILFALADTAMAYASNSHGKVAVASTVTIDYLRSVPCSENLLARAEEVYRGRSKGSYRVILSNSAGKEVAYFYGTVAILEKDVIEPTLGDRS